MKKTNDKEVLKKKIYQTFTISASVLAEVKKRLHGQKLSPLIENLLNNWITAHDKYMVTRAKVESKELDRMIKEYKRRHREE